MTGQDLHVELRRLAEDLARCRADHVAPPARWRRKVERFERIEPDALARVRSLADELQRIEATDRPDEPPW